MDRIWGVGNTLLKLKKKKDVSVGVAAQEGRDQGTLCYPSCSERSQSAKTKKTVSSVCLYISYGCGTSREALSSRLCRCTVD